MTFTSHITPTHRTRIIAGLRACIGAGQGFGMTARKADFMRAGAVSTK